MRAPFLILPALVLMLSACQSTTGDFTGGTGNDYYYTTSAGLPPPPGRTAEQRSERRSYYMGPRGDTF